MIMTERDDVKKFLTDQLLEKLALCTPEQQSLFHAMYPRGVEKFKDCMFDTALSQIERTIEKNKAKAANK